MTLDHLRNVIECRVTTAAVVDDPRILHNPPVIRGVPEEQALGA